MQGDAGLDLSCLEAAHIGPGERWGVGHRDRGRDPRRARRAGPAALRPGPRTHGISLVNSPGLIDSGYRGEMRVLLLNNDPAETFRVQPGDRIAQLVLVPIALAEPVEAEALADRPAAHGGFGSSGR